MIIKKDYSFLPGIIIEIANIIDMEYAVKIAALANAKQKNISVYFPEKVKREHVLSMVLPFEKVQQLASHYKGETIIIPQTKKVSNILKSKKFEVTCLGNRGSNHGIRVVTWITQDSHGLGYSPA